MQLFPSLDKCFGIGTSAAKNMTNGGCGWKELSPIVNDLLKNLLLAGVFIAMLMIMYAGYVLVKGQGSPDSLTRVKNIFKGIVIGIFLLTGGYYIVEFALNTIGVNEEYRKDSLPIRQN